jgi:hypothetical protein
MPFQDEALVKEDESAKPGAIDKIDLGKVENNVLFGFGEAFDMGPDAGNVGGVEIVVNLVFLRHDRLYPYR